MTAARVSIHGGHSREFGDAGDSTLEEMVRAYVDNGFQWVGITEHIPPASADFLLPWETEEGQTPESRMERFTEYFSAARRLQGEYRDSIRIFVGFETEGYTGYVEHVNRLRKRFRPDYIVGSVHHVRDICIDGRPERYAQAVAETGGIEALFCEYFDQQYELIEELEPEVVGHFDLIRMHDKDYRQRLEIPGVKKRIRRNLEKIRDLGSILDFNLRALEKGGSEPYVSRSILEMALDIGVPCVPGDDSHGVAGVGLHLDKGIEILRQAGFSTEWQLPGKRHIDETRRDASVQ
ncbi:MAG: histidinol-phosphatase [Gemmatimonadaceae bacterium]|nr:histidinol-phosphatase [Gemmatimonadaceae bacterium]